MTSALAPTKLIPSPGLRPPSPIRWARERGRIVRRAFENLYDWIGRTLIRKTRNHRKLFPPLSAYALGFGAIASKRSEDGGETIKGEVGLNTHSPENVEEA